MSTGNGTRDLKGTGGEALMSIVQLEARFGKAWRYDSTTLLRSETFG